MSKKLNAATIAKLVDIVCKKFDNGDWVALSVILDDNGLVTNHPRLLRSLGFNDDDYPACAADVIIRLLKLNENASENIIDYVTSKYPDESKGLQSNTTTGTISVQPKVFDCKKQFVNNERQVALMMPFKSELDNVHNTIRIACNELEFTCVRADQVWDNPTVMQDVFDLIYTSKCVIVDLTGLNPNVMYELGLAHALGVVVVPICSTETHSPFDIVHHRHIKYNLRDITSDNFVSKLKAAILHSKTDV
jgi:AbiJ N-terminal domain 5